MTHRHSTGEPPLRGVPSSTEWMARNGRQRDPRAPVERPRASLLARLLGGRHHIKGQQE